jgi:hypothetical protein
MKLYCDKCQTIHHLTLSAIERLVYVLEANLHDLKGDKDVLQHANVHQCLQTWESESGEVYLYKEHVQATVEARKRLQNEQAQ